MSDFQYQGPLEDDPATTIARGLREKRLRFTKKIPNDHDSDICSPRDRRSALSVFDEAVEKICEDNRLEVTTEADYKIRVILGITKAQPSASVFQNKQQLSPIDPQYAEPPITQLGGCSTGAKTVGPIRFLREPFRKSELCKGSPDLGKIKNGLSLED
ncbi:uncharacterized protein J4E87_005904 [Alternaria ethzedia]|uniref:uncharacterized protein n=1 Tax=Alternaria ethzedia TaxID=181014 RepID=UPI0020C5A709|nr:uncharacterized protein J4E87_005904 [Alternaria ethzedia]KAI4622811.1 hypothetical protein J4E87_005904 [Alternaria ethzedia]